MNKAQEEHTLMTLEQKRIAALKRTSQAYSAYINFEKMYGKPFYMQDASLAQQYSDLLDAYLNATKELAQYESLTEEQSPQ